MSTDFIDDYLSYLKSIRNLGNATLLAYGRDLKGFFSWAEGYLEKPLSIEAVPGQAGLAELDLSILRAWLSVSTRKGLNPRSINRQISALKGFFRYHIKRGNLESSPLDGLRSLRTRGRLPSWFFENDMAALLDRQKAANESRVSAAVSLAGPQGAGEARAVIFDARRTQAILEVLYSTGCRVSELAGMSLGRLDLVRGRVLVLGKGRKERLVFLGETALSSLRDWLAARQEFFPHLVQSAQPGQARQAVFLNRQGGRLSVRSIQKIVEAAQNQAGMKGRLSPHGFRHSFASHILDHGADIRVVQELLGHASLSTTQIYTHTSLGRLKELHAQAHPHGQRRTSQSAGLAPASSMPAGTASRTTREPAPKVLPATPARPAPAVLASSPVPPAGRITKGTKK